MQAGTVWINQQRWLMTELCCLQSNAFDRWTRKPFESSPVKTLSCIRIIQLWIPIEGVVCLVSSRFLIRFASPGNGKGALQLFLCRLRELGYDEESDIGWPVWFVCLFALLLAKRYGLRHWKERWTNGDGATLTKVGTGKTGHRLDLSCFALYHSQRRISCDFHWFPL